MAKKKSNDVGLNMNVPLGNYCNLAIDVGADLNDATNIVRHLVDEFLKDKILDKNSIHLKEPLYFNMKELLEFKEVQTVYNPSIKDIDSYCILVNVPNNVDELSKEYVSYCFNNEKHRHLGIEPIIVPDNINIIYDGGEFIIEDLEDAINLIVFDYNVESNSTSLKLIKPDYIFNICKDKTTNQIISENVDTIKNQIEDNFMVIKQPIIDRFYQLGCSESNYIYKTCRKIADNIAFVFNPYISYYPTKANPELLSDLANVFIRKLINYYNTIIKSNYVMSDFPNSFIEEHIRYSVYGYICQLLYDNPVVIHYIADNFDEYSDLLDDNLKSYFMIFYNKLFDKYNA